MSSLHPAIPWTAIAVLTVGLAAAAWALLVGDRPRGRLRCPRCWYDMAGAPGLTCPECGRTVRRPHHLRRTRRRWRLGLAAVLLALAPTVGLLATGHRADLLRRILPHWQLSERYQFGRCVVRVLVPRQFEEDPRDWDRRIVVSHAGRTLLDVEDWGVSLGVRRFDRPGVIGLNEDITGDGVPELTVSVWTGGAHCCSTYHILRLGDDPRLLATIEAQHGGANFAPTETPGLLAIELADWTFAYWKECFAASPAPRIVMVPEGDGYRLAPERMAAPLPPRRDLDALAASLRAADHLDSQLWRTMLDLMYTGHEPEAWAFFDAAWPVALSGKDEFKAEFVAELAKSPYWPTLRSAFAAADSAGH